MDKRENFMSGILYIVSTPIGNLEDITYRAVRILSEVDLIAAEDTRHSLKLLNHFNISKPLTSYYDHNQQLKGERILSNLRQGKNVALVSDAGTPCVSDPGYHLVRDALSEGIQVIPIPGCCAAITALSGAGLPSDNFTFAGFPPARQGKRRTFLAGLAETTGTLILYEAPHRLESTLSDMYEVLGDRQIAIARELTKIYEEFILGTVSEVITAVSQAKVRGEVVILIAPGEATTKEVESLDSVLDRLLNKEGLSIKDAAKKTAEITGVSRNEAYSKALKAREDEDSLK